MQHRLRSQTEHTRCTCRSCRHAGTLGHVCETLLLAHLRYDRNRPEDTLNIRRPSWAHSFGVASEQFHTIIKLFPFPSTPPVHRFQVQCVDAVDMSPVIDIFRNNSSGPSCATPVAPTGALEGVIQTLIKSFHCCLTYCTCIFVLCMYVISLRRHRKLLSRGTPCHRFYPLATACQTVWRSSAQRMLLSRYTSKLIRCMGL